MSVILRNNARKDRSLRPPKWFAKAIQLHLYAALQWSIHFRLINSQSTLRSTDPPHVIDTELRRECCIRCAKLLGDCGAIVGCDARFNGPRNTVRCWRCSTENQQCVPVRISRGRNYLNHLTRSAPRILPRDRRWCNCAASRYRCTARHNQQCNCHSQQCEEGIEDVGSFDRPPSCPRRERHTFARPCSNQTGR